MELIVGNLIRAERKIEHGVAEWFIDLLFRPGDISLSHCFVRHEKLDGNAVRHFLDTFQLIPLLEGITGPVLDAGTGGGIPGLPLAIFRPDLEVVMIDGTAKKIVYVREWAKALGLEKAGAHHARVENHLKTFGYDALICRAAVKPATMMEILNTTGPCVKDLIFMEGAKGKETARKIAPLARSAGYALAAITSYRLPGLERERYLVTFTRGKKPPRRR